MTSPPQLPQSKFDARPSFDFSSSPPTKPYTNLNDFNGGPPNSFSFGNSGRQLQNVVQQPFSNGAQNNAVGGVQMSSQTPYGPHVQTNGATAAGGPGSVITATAPPNPAPARDAAQEEISTIFVVGFPEDMQVGTLILDTLDVF